MLYALVHLLLKPSSLEKQPTCLEANVNKVQIACGREDVQSCFRFCQTLNTSYHSDMPLRFLNVSQPPCLHLLVHCRGS